MQLRHSCEIHAIPADNQCQRKENHRNDRKYIHHAIQADIHLRLIGFTNLHTVIAQGAGMLSQPFHPIGTDAKMVQLLSGKQVVFILQQLLAYIAELLIILQQVANPVSDSGNPLIEILQIIIQNIIIQLLNQILELIVLLLMLLQKEFKEQRKNMLSTELCCRKLLKQPKKIQQLIRILTD